MKLFSIIAALAMFVSLRASAGEMYGAITHSDKPVGEKVKIGVTVSGTTYTTETDKNGGYRLFVKEKGKCLFTVHYAGDSLAADVFSYDKSLRYDWKIDQKDGKNQLKRK